MLGWIISGELHVGEKTNYVRCNFFFHTLSPNPLNNLCELGNGPKMYGCYFSEGYLVSAVEGLTLNAKSIIY